jgi:GAF domain-containing protein
VHTPQPEGGGGSATTGQQAPASGPRRTKLATVRRVADERAYLYELIQTIGSGPDLDSILRGVVRLVTEATACHACFIYFLREDGLELRVASTTYAHLEGRVRIPFGEGLTGWVAKTRRSGFIKEGALDDPRVRRAYFPELGDEVYQSLVSVPIFARSGEILGVITLHAEAPHEFARSDLDFLEHTASLIAGAVDNARLYEEATARIAHLSDLSRLSQRIASADSRDAVSAIVTEGTRQLFDAERCEIFLADLDGRLRLAAARPDRPAPGPLDLNSLWIRTLEGRDPRSEERRQLGSALWGDEQAGTPFVVPLVVGDERLGIIAVLVRQGSADIDAILRAIASHTAVALKQHQVIEWLREKNLLKDFFQALARPDTPVGEILGMAQRLGCDVDASHLLIHILPWASPTPRSRRGRVSRPHHSATWADLAGQVEARLSARFSGLMVDRLERSIRVLVPLATLTAEEAVASLREMDWGATEGETGQSVGVSNPCAAVAAYARGFEEAASAAEVGALIRGGPGVTTYEELGPYKYVLNSEEGVRDRYRERLASIVDYDRRRGTRLLDTLESYLDLRGNVVGTSRALFIHPNTLRQRLGRIEHVSGIDLERDDWLSLAVATKVVKLQKMREAAREGGNDG